MATLMRVMLEDLWTAGKLRHNRAAIELALEAGDFERVTRALAEGERMDQHGICVRCRVRAAQPGSVYCGAACSAVGSCSRGGA